MMAALACIAVLPEVIPLGALPPKPTSRAAEAQEEIQFYSLTTVSG